VSEQLTVFASPISQAAGRGQLGGVVTEDALIKMLENAGGGGGGGGGGEGRGGPKITRVRKNIMDDDDW
jgi:programmed cell death protein 5